MQKYFSGLHALGNLIFVLEVGSQLLSGPNDGPHLHQVIDALEAGRLSNGQLHVLEEIGALAILWPIPPGSFI